MKVIRFPGAAAGDAAGLAAGERLDALLGGEFAGAEGEALRALREDVRALAVPLAPEFEEELQARLAEWSAAAERARARRRPRNERLRGPRRWVGASRGRMLGASGATVVIVVALAAVAIGSGWFRSTGTSSSASVKSAPGSARVTAAEAPGQESSEHSAKTLPEAVAKANSGASRPAGGEARSAPPTGAAGQALETSNGPIFAGPSVSSPSPAAPGRLQQLVASVTLATSPGGVQQAAEAAARLAVGDGGFVEQSHVQVRSSGGPSEAQLRLQVPSGKLASAIVALGRIAPERAVNQESEDITSAYDGAKRRLGDAEAVRRALLRALAAATSEGAIDSLRERLAQNRAQIAEYRSQVKAEAHRAATSELEVTITSTNAPHAGRGTLDQGLRDAGHVLAVAGAVALIVLAVLVPLGLAALVLDVLRRAWLRRRRESALDA